MPVSDRFPSKDEIVLIIAGGADMSTSEFLLHDTMRRIASAEVFIVDPLPQHLPPVPPRIEFENHLVLKPTRAERRAARPKKTTRLR